jgi:hypothetical protein
MSNISSNLVNKRGIVQGLLQSIFKQIKDPYFLQAFSMLLNILYKNVQTRIFLNGSHMNTSCRSCGRYLIPVLHWNVCRESISWIYNSCERLKDVTHCHTMVAEDANRRED